MPNHTIATLFIFTQLFTTVNAEITFDGSTGTAGSLPGPNYLIDANRGSIQGDNLFHSFGRFNINTGENATFTGPNHLTNIIGRVTGNQASLIDGTLNSVIPAANLYFLNPNGVMFGPNARLNVDGSFYLSTADYLRFADGQRFETQSATPPILTIAAPQAFGFLDAQPGNITINGSNLSVPVGRDLSIVGGDIQIQGQDASNAGALFAPGGSLQIASAASAGEVMQSNVMDNTLTQFGNVVIQEELLNTNDYPGREVLIRGGRFFMNNAAIQTHADLGYGNIDIKANESLQIKVSLIQTLTNQRNAGNIVLRGQQIELSEGSTIANITQGAGQAGDIIIEATDSASITGKTLVSSITAGTGKSGNITLTAPQLQINDNSKITNITQSTGQSGDVVVKTEHLTLTNGALILVKAEKSGSSGMVNIQATKSISITGFDKTGNQSKIVNQTTGKGKAGTLTIISPVILLSNHGIIGADTFGEGKGGSILIKADNIKINSSANITSGSASTGDSGKVQIEATQLELDAGLIQALTFAQGNAGNIQLQVNKLVLANGAQIDASSVSDGQGGAITVMVTESAEIFGQTAVAPQGGVVNPSSIGSSAFGEGDGGTINFSAQTLNLDKRGTIQTLTQGNGNAGDIILNIKNLRITEGGDIDASNEGSGQGKGGNITINATGEILITAEFFEGQFFGGIYSSADNAGAGGDVSLSAGQLALQQGGVISVASNGSGNAGHLILNVNGALKIEAGGQINTSTQNAAGGNITVTTPALLYLRKGQITTSVKGGKGDGGNITIGPPTFVVMDDGKIIAQAFEGDGGNITIDSQQFVRTTDAKNQVDASSKLGISGNVVITAPENDIAGSLIVLSAKLLDVSGLLQKPCSAMSYEEYINRSRLLVIPLAGNSLSPFDLKPSHLPRRSEKSAKRSTAPKTGNSDKTTKVLKPGTKVMVCRAEAKNRKSSVSPEQLF